MILHNEYFHKYPTLASAQGALESIKQQIYAITKDTFSSYENEYSIFCPMSNCFELFGFDFLIDENMKVHLLEINPGPDFKQTGGRLRELIENLWDQTLRIVIDKDALTENSEKSAQELLQKNGLVLDYTLVYSQKWSVASIKGGMKVV